jgi:molybdopterin/thiamine biosynthesis adenylyltransferase/molybdopterin converting factor small subunit
MTTRPTRALVIGAGGLGGPIALELARAGVRLTIADPDQVAVSNLHRQVQFTPGDVGRAKLDALADALVARGLPRPHLVPRRIGVADLDRVAAGADVVVDATDDATSKFEVAAWASRTGRAHVIAAAVGYGGQVFARAAAMTDVDAPCYACLFEAPPDDAATCARDGVLGPAVGLIAGLAVSAALAPPAPTELGELRCVADVRVDVAPRTIHFRRRPTCAAHPRPIDRRPGGKEHHMATVRIPTPLRKLTDGKDEVQVQGATVRAALDDLERLHPGIRARICDEAGAVKKFINLFANDEDIRGLQNLDTPLRDADELSIVPAIAGG